RRLSRADADRCYRRAGAAVRLFRDPQRGDLRVGLGALVACTEPAWIRLHLRPGLDLGVSLLPAALFRDSRADSGPFCRLLCRDCFEARAPVDGLLVFGVPLVGFGLQAALVRDVEYGAAWSALTLAIVYGL